MTIVDTLRRDRADFEELQALGRRHAEEISAEEPGLDPAALRREVAPPIRGDAVSALVVEPVEEDALPGRRPHVEPGRLLGADRELGRVILRLLKIGFGHPPDRA